MKCLILVIAFVVIVASIGYGRSLDCLSNCSYEAQQLLTLCIQNGGSSSDCAYLAYLNQCACAQQECNVQLPSCPSQ